MGIIISILLALFGVTLILEGYRVVRFLASILFAGFLGIIGFKEGLTILGSVVLALIPCMVLFIIGAVIGFIAYKVSLSIIGGYILSSIVLKVMVSYMYINVLAEYYLVALLILTILFASIIYVVLDHLLVVGLAIMGGILVFSSLMNWLPIIIVTPLVMALIVIGVLHQLRHIKD